MAVTFTGTWGMSPDAQKHSVHPPKKQCATDAINACVPGRVGLPTSEQGGAKPGVGTMTNEQPNIMLTGGNGDNGGNGRHNGGGLHSIKLDVFEGPLDLLLYLIKKDEIDIYDIPIARITAQYLEYLHLMETLDLEIAGDYLVVAATLIRVKSSMLLPKDPGAEEDEDPRDELVRALLEYRKYKEVSLELREREQQTHDIYGRSDLVAPVSITRSEFVNEHTLFDLLRSFKDVLDRVEEEIYCEVAVDRVTVEQRISYIESALENSTGVRFADLLDDNPTRNIIVLTFIALLELLRTGRIGLRQNRPFSDIWLYPVAA
jgi:segregation and condensation protein A